MTIVPVLSTCLRRDDLEKLELRSVTLRQTQQRGDGKHGDRRVSYGFLGGPRRWHLDALPIGWWWHLPFHQENPYFTFGAFLVLFLFFFFFTKKHEKAHKGKSLAFPEIWLFVLFWYFFFLIPFFTFSQRITKKQKKAEKVKYGFS